MQQQPKQSNSYGLSLRKAGAEFSGQQRPIPRYALPEIWNSDSIFHTGKTKRQRPHKFFRNKSCPEYSRGISALAKTYVHKRQKWSPFISEVDN
jgi:hypothetical protein